MLLAATVARAFDFRVELSAGQKVYFTIIAGTQTVKVVNPDWDSYTPPTGALTLPATVENNGTVYNVVAIDNNAFRDCTGLTSIVIPEGVTSIGRMSFSQCTSLAAITLPSTLTVVGSFAFNGTAYFSNSDNITDNGLLFIGAYLIASLPSRATGEIALPEGILGLGNTALYNCSSLERVVLPSSVRFIGENAFNGCTSLDTLEMLGTEPPSLESNAFTDVEDFAVLVPCHSSETYLEANNWSSLTIVENCNGSGPGPGPGPNPQGIDEVTGQSLTITIMEGGIVIDGAEGRQVRISDLTGRRVAESRGGFVALPTHGVYIVNTPGMKPLKVLF